MRRIGRRRVPLGADAVPHARVRDRGRHVAARLRGLLLRRLPGHRRRSGHGLGAPVGEVKRLAEWIQGKEEVRVTAPGTDITLDVAGRHWIPCVGEHNMPDGEFFTGPVEDSVNGEITFSFPAIYGGRRCRACLPLRGRQGRRRVGAEQGEEFLLEMLDTDEGARRLGEIGIGTNYGIATGTKEILLDEKIGGTVHLAIGMSYPETGGTNNSAVHWDMVCDLRQGGAMVVDGVELQRDGGSWSRPATFPPSRLQREQPLVGVVQQARPVRRRPPARRPRRT